MKRLTRLGFLVLYVLAAGVVFFGVEKYTSTHVEGLSAQPPTLGGIWALDRLIFLIVAAAIVRDDFVAFVRSWKHAGLRSHGVVRLVGQAGLAMAVLAASVWLVAELSRLLKLA